MPYSSISPFFILELEVRKLFSRFIESLHLLGGESNTAILSLYMFHLLFALT